MIAIDTNVLLRYLLNADNPAQGEFAVGLVDRAARRGEPVFVSTLVLCELAWTLKAALGMDRPGLLATLQRVLAQPRFVFGDGTVLRQSVEDFAHGKAEFADYVIGRLGETAGATTTYTFDRIASAAATFKRLDKRSLEER